jgi:hypothetical protein
MAAVLIGPATKTNKIHGSHPVVFITKQTTHIQSMPHTYSIPVPYPLHICYMFFSVFPMAFAAQSRAMASSFTRSLDHTQRRTTIGRTPLDEWSARRRDLYLTTHNTPNRQTSILPADFEPRRKLKYQKRAFMIRWWLYIQLERGTQGTGHIQHFGGEIRWKMCMWNIETEFKR